MLRRYVGPSSKQTIETRKLNEPDKLTADWWTDNWKKEKAVFMDPGFAQPQIMTIEGHDEYYIFYEYRGEKNRWHIGVTRSDSVAGPYDIHHFPVLSPEHRDESPDGKHVADPSVVYLPDRDPPWHMWYDMCDMQGVWRLGHAMSQDGIQWQKERNEDGHTEVTLDVGVEGKWDDGFLHAPEVFKHGERLQMLYNAQGTGHTGFDGGLATQVGDDLKFKKVGQVTDDNTTDIGAEHRIKPPIEIDGTLYTLVGWDGAGTATVIRSDDGGKSWERIVEFPHHMTHSFVIENGIIYGIGSDKHIIYKKLPLSGR